MRRGMLVGLLAGGLSACVGWQPERVATVRDLAPAQRVSALLQAYQTQSFRGLPSAEQAAALAPHLSSRLKDLLRAARAGQQAYRSQFPDDKPPMVDGDLFSSLFEGATGFTVGAVSKAGDTASVSINYVYAEPDGGRVMQAWSDQVWLVRVGDLWLVDDIEYRGGWDFSVRGRLSAALIETASWGQ